MKDYCAQYYALKQLHVSQAKTLRWHIQTTVTRSRIGQTPNYSECLVRTHPSRTAPGIVILDIKCNYHWLCVLTLVISGAIAQFDADKTVSFAWARAGTLSGGFNVIGPVVASNEFKHLPHEQVLRWLAMTVACRLAPVIQAWKGLRWRGLRPGIEATQLCVVSHTQSRWEFIPRQSSFSCLKRCHPIVFAWDLWSRLWQNSEYKNYSYPLTISTDGSAYSPSSGSEARTPELASGKAVKHAFPRPCTQMRARSRTSVSCKYMWTLWPFPATSTACKIMIVSNSSCVLTPVLNDFSSLQCHFCGSLSPGSQNYSDWRVVEPNKEWANSCCHYLAEILCVCPWCKSNLLQKSNIGSRSLDLVSTTFPCGWLDWSHMLLQLQAITLTCSIGLLIRSTWHCLGLRMQFLKFLDTGSTILCRVHTGLLYVLQQADCCTSVSCSMYVCIYLFTRHGYTKVYSDNENNCEFG